jgi:hypothetical protein
MCVLSATDIPAVPQTMGALVLLLPGQQLRAELPGVVVHQCKLNGTASRSTAL